MKKVQLFIEFRLLYQPLFKKRQIWLCSSNLLKMFLYFSNDSHIGRFHHKQLETIKIECVQQLSGFCIKAYLNRNFMVT